MLAADTLKMMNPTKRPVSAANQYFALPQSGQSAVSSVGWDPFEVWRRMVKEPRERRLAEQA